MRSLYLFRHAKASQGGKEGPHDHERPLTDDGIAAARAVGAALKAGGHDLGFVLCSTARRAVETYENVAYSYPGLDARLDRAVYEADAGRLLRMVQGFDDGVATATVFGHNPTHHDLAVRLAHEGEPKLRAHLSHTFSPAMVVRIDFDVDRWDRVTPKLGTLTFLLDPKDLIPV